MLRDIFRRFAGQSAIFCAKLAVDSDYMLFLSVASIRFSVMKRLFLLLCLLAAACYAAAQTAAPDFAGSLPERLARPLDDTLVALRNLELLAPRRVMQSFDVTADTTVYISQLGAFEKQLPGRTRSHEVYVFEIRSGCDTMSRMTLRYFGHGANIAVEECGGVRYVWIDSNATRIEGEYWQSCTVSRVPFRAGAVYDHDGGETFYFDDGCFNLLPAVDVAHNLLSISYRKADGTHGFRHFRLDEALSLPDTVLRIVRTWGGEQIGECERTEQRTIRCRDLRRLVPLGGFILPHGEDTARDFCSYPFQGFDIDDRSCYLFEGAGNGNKPANGPSNARITVTTLDGGIVHWRLPVAAYSDREGLRALGLTDTGYAEAEGIKRKGGRLWLGAATRRSADPVRRANLFRY